MARWLLIVFVVLWTLAMWAAVAYVVWRAWSPHLRSRRQQKTRIGAKVKARQGTQELNPLTWRHELTQKMLVFDCDDGVERDYEVPDRLFDSVGVGDDGVLVYQGELFVDFEARRPKQDADELYGKWTRG